MLQDITKQNSSLFLFFWLMNFLSFYWGRLTYFCTPRSTNSKHTQSEQLKLVSWKKTKKKRASLLLTYLRCKFDPGTSSWLRLFHITFSASSLQGIYKRYERREHPVTFFHCQRCRKKTKWVFIVLPSCTVTIKVHILYHHQLLKTDQKWTLQNTNKEKHLNIAIQI